MTMIQTAPCATLGVIDPSMVQQVSFVEWTQIEAAAVARLGLYATDLYEGFTDAATWSFGDSQRVLVGAAELTAFVGPLFLELGADAADVTAFLSEVAVLLSGDVLCDVAG